MSSTCASRSSLLLFTDPLGRIAAEGAGRVTSLPISRLMSWSSRIAVHCREKVRALYSPRSFRAFARHQSGKRTWPPCDVRAAGAPLLVEALHAAEAYRCSSLEHHQRGQPHRRAPLLPALIFTIVVTQLPFVVSACRTAAAPEAGGGTRPLSTCQNSRNFAAVLSRSPCPPPPSAPRAGTGVSLVARFARLGCTRSGSPGIFGYSGG
jgi:hypothetical protein